MQKTNKLIILQQDKNTTDQKQHWSKISSPMRVSLSSNNFIFNESKRALIALDKTKNPQNLHKFNRSMNLNCESSELKNDPSMKMRHQSCNLISSKISKRINDGSQINKFTRKGRSYSTYQQNNRTTAKVSQKTNIINMTGNVETESVGQPISRKYKSSYCKKITMSNIDKYYRYCVTRLKDKIIDPESYFQEYSEDGTPKYIPIKTSNIEQEKVPPKDGQLQNQLLGSLLIDKQALIKNAARIQNYRKTQKSRQKEGRLLYSQNSNRIEPRKYRKTSLFQSSDKKQEFGLSPWQTPEQNNLWDLQT